MPLTPNNANPCMEPIKSFTCPECQHVRGVPLTSLISNIYTRLFLPGVPAGAAHGGSMIQLFMGTSGCCETLRGAARLALHFSQCKSGCLETGRSLESSTPEVRDWQAPVSATVLSRTLHRRT